MKVAAGSDHAGYPVKMKAIAILGKLGCEVEDLGTHSEASCDYPDFAVLVAERVASGQADFGLLCCGTGLGMCMAANKVPGIRAATCHNDFTAELARRHNDANILCIGGRVLDDPTLETVVRRFFQTPFDGGRHLRRVKKIAKLDRLR